MNHLFVKLSALSMMMLLPIMGWALESDSKQPINIEADEALLNDKTGFTEYKGRAILTQGTLKIEGDTITFHFDKNKEITKAVAVGKLATYQQVQKQGEDAVKARGTRMEYFPSTQTIVLIGKAYVTQNGDTFSGPRIKYDIAKNIVYAGKSAASGNTGEPAETGGRVHVVIQPAGNKTSVVAPIEPMPEPVEIDNATAGTGFATTRLNIRAEPDVTSVKVGSLPPHGQFTVLNENEGWLQIQTNVSGEDLIGWVSRTYVKLNN